MLVDTHCHLDFPEFDQDRDEVIQRARECGINYIINIGSSLEGSESSLGLSQKYASVYASIGIHPHEADKFNQEIREAVSRLAKNDKVVAIGEIGLDYYKNYSKAVNQMPLFISLVKLAKDLNLPIILHTRQAQDDTLKVLKEYMPLKAVVHCFSGDENFLHECLELGFFISFTCNITYKKAQNLRNLVKVMPLDRLFLETDAPFLAPEGFRGKRNEPAQVKLLAEEIAKIKEKSFAEVAKVTSENAINFFNLR